MIQYKSERGSVLSVLSAPVQREVQGENVHPPLAQNAQGAALDVPLHERRTSAGSFLRARATRGTW